jgi:coenzyme F420-0:L-glutamate ligase / coenzyme F420-1:gamma-L-glutamate ligase
MTDRKSYELHTLLRTRRSVRLFRTEPIPLEMIQRILTTAICAPSAHNLQPWRFVVLTSIETKLHLAESIADKFRQDMIADGIPEDDIQARIAKTLKFAGGAPVIIVLFRESTKIKPQPDGIRQQAEVLMGIQSVALAGLQLLLAAKVEGLGGTWICWPLFAPEETRHALGLAPEWEPQGMIFLGYPDETPEMPARISLQEVTKYL